MTDKPNCPQHAAHEQRFKGIENQLEKYEDNQSKTAEVLTNLVERVTAAEQSTRSAHHRIDSQEEQTRAIYQLAFEVKGLSEKHSEILDLLTDHDNRLDTIEKAPGQQALKAYEWLKYTVAGGILGLFFGYALWFLTNKK